MDVNPQTKDFFQSKTSWGMILIALQPVLAHYGLTLPITDDVVNSFIQGAGTLLFVWGQLSRSTAINTVAGVAVVPAPKTGGQP